METPRSRLRDPIAEFVTYSQDVSRRRRRLPLIVPVALAAVFLLPGGSRADNPVLTADVGLNDTYAIGLKSPSGTPVSQLTPGTYTLLVHDHSTLHNFHLTGPGVNVASTVAGT